MLRWDTPGTQRDTGTHLAGSLVLAPLSSSGGKGRTRAASLPTPARCVPASGTQPPLSDLGSFGLPVRLDGVMTHRGACRFTLRASFNEAFRNQQLARQVYRSGLTAHGVSDRSLRESGIGFDRERNALHQNRGPEGPRALAAPD